MLLLYADQQAQVEEADVARRSLDGEYEAIKAGPQMYGIQHGKTRTDADPAQVPVDIEVKDLVKQFGDFTAVAHTSFQVHQGEVFGLLGPNGAGKTTTFRMLCGLLPRRVASSAWRAWICARRARRQGQISVMWRRSFPCTISSPFTKIFIFLAGYTVSHQRG